MANMRAWCALGFAWLGMLRVAGEGGEQGHGNANEAHWCDPGSRAILYTCPHLAARIQGDSP